MRKAMWLGICTLALGFGASLASADVITVAVTGHVIQVNGSLGVTQGQAVTGTYSYDASSPSSGPAGFAPGLAYLFTSPPSSMTVSIVGGPTYQTDNTWTFQGGVVQTGTLAFAYSATSPSSTNGSPTLFYQFSDSNNQWLSSSFSLPTTVPPLSSGVAGVLIITPTTSSNIYVQIDTATLVPSITVSPANSSFIAQQNFDAVLLLSAQLSVTSMQASVGGNAIGFSYPGTCQLAQPNNAQRTALICPNAAAVLAGLGGGPVTINWLITLADGSTIQQSVIWNLVL